MGVMFMVACLIEVFGVVAAVTVCSYFVFSPLPANEVPAQRRLVLIRAYALGSVLACLLVIAASLMGVVIHFVHKVGWLLCSNVIICTY